MAVMSQPDSRRVFRIKSPFQQMRVAGIACVAALVIVFLTLPPADSWIILILGAVLLLALGIGYWFLTRTRLEISPQEIVYYGIGYAVRSRWSNIKGYGKRVFGAQTYEALLLTEPGIEVSGWMKLGYALMPVAEIASAAQGRIFIPEGLGEYQDAIPVGIFDGDWRSSELGALIKQYAPEAFDHLIT
ncbi:MAG TPA: hypothetical protein VHD90_09395 [Phototrophicaceae bacterium]|nr:hypothetical protein [Phototrophicaceae bacterium]